MFLNQDYLLRRKRILVTGASGFIGSHLIQKLDKMGAKVLAFYRSAPPSFMKSKSVEMRRLSLLNFKQLSQLVTKFRPEKIVHLAGFVNLERSFHVAKTCIRANIESTLNLLESLNPVPIDVFVYVSTAEVYGSGKIPYQETQKELPPSPYAITKLAGEQFCRFYSNLHQYPICILRVSSCYGPGQEAFRFIPSVILSCLKSKPIQLNSGNQKRDFLYIEDAVDGILKSLVTKNALSQVINIGSANAYRFIDIVKKIKSLIGSASSIVLGSVPDRTAESLYWKSDSSKARKLLGWQAAYSLEQGLVKTIDWHKKQHGGTWD